mmetsp:Transcript_34775/g.99896  ORF Transcript_34775/g.99896 Transcript_34775/m.99896 type:complete len:236 (+) Transcript_34775:331-1038(+)
MRWASQASNSSHSWADGVFTAAEATGSADVWTSGCARCTSAPPKLALCTVRLGVGQAATRGSAEACGIRVTSAPPKVLLCTAKRGAAQASWPGSLSRTGTLSEAGPVADSWATAGHSQLPPRPWDTSVAARLLRSAVARFLPTARTKADLTLCGRKPRRTSSWKARSALAARGGWAAPQAAMSEAKKYSFSGWPALSRALMTLSTFRKSPTRANALQMVPKVTQLGATPSSNIMR